MEDILNMEGKFGGHIKHGARVNLEDILNMEGKFGGHIKHGG